MYDLAERVRFRVTHSLALLGKMIEKGHIVRMLDLGDIQGDIPMYNGKTQSTCIGGGLTSKDLGPAARLGRSLGDVRVRGAGEQKSFPRKSACPLWLSLALQVCENSFRLTRRLPSVLVCNEAFSLLSF